MNTLGEKVGASVPGVITSVLSAAEPFVPFVALPGPARGLCQEVMRATTAAPWAAGAAQRRSATAAAARAETIFSPGSLGEDGGERQLRGCHALSSGGD